MATFLNAVALYPVQAAALVAKQATHASMLPLFLNSVVAAASIVLSAFFGMRWRACANARSELIEEIESRDEFEIEVYRTPAASALALSEAAAEIPVPESPQAVDEAAQEIFEAAASCPVQSGAG